MNKVKAKKQKPLVDQALSTANDPTQYDVDPQLLKEIRDKGLKERWISRGKYLANHGDSRGYRPYQMEVAKMEKKGSLDFQYGVDPEGYICRGDLILAVRPNALHEANKRKIENKNRAQLGYSKQAADKLRETTGMKVIEGYEDEVKGYSERGQEDIGDD